MSVLPSLFAVLLSFQFGYIPDGSTVNYGTSQYEYDRIDIGKAFSAEFEVEIKLFNFFFFKGTYNSIFYSFVPGYAFGFSPDHDIFTVDTGISYKGLVMGWKSECKHPIYPYQFTSYNPEIVTKLEGHYSEFYVRFNAKVEF